MKLILSIDLCRNSKVDMIKILMLSAEIVKLIKSKGGLFEGGFLNESFFEGVFSENAFFT